MLHCLSFSSGRLVSQNHLKMNVSSGMKTPQFGIVMMIHNDDDILPYWLRYHSQILSLQNIVILDNNSGPKTIEILNSWEKKGLKVLYNQGPYAKKGDLTLAAFHQNLSYIDIAIPLDSDEFLVAFNGSEPIAKADLMLENLIKLYHSNESCWALQQYYPSLNLNLNDTVSTIQYFHPSIYPVQFAKKIIRMDALAGLDHGSHLPVLKYGRYASALNQLGLLHYHHRNPQVKVERALNDMKGFFYLPANVTLETVSQYQDQLQKVISSKLQGSHKAIQLLDYIQLGYKALLHNVVVRNDSRIETLDVLVEKLSQEDGNGRTL